MIELNVSLQSSKASVRQVQTQYQQSQSLVFQGKTANTLGFLNNQENQIVDDVSISNQAIQALEEAKKLDNFLQQYLAFLKGDDQSLTVRFVPAQDDSNVVIAARSTELSASITQVSYEEESLDLTARFDNDGNLQELIIEKTSFQASYTQAELILQDTQFYAVT